MVVLLYGLRAIAKRDGNTYALYSLGMLAAPLTQYTNMRLFDYYNHPRAYR